MNVPTPPDLYFTESGSGPPLLLVHGLAISGEMFEPIVGPLAAHHRLIIPDLRGSGGSRNLAPPFSVKQQAADLSRLLDHLGIRTTDVLGYSQGGPVVQQLALDDPARVKRLVLVNTYAHNMISLREKLEGHLVPLLIRLLGMRRFARFVIALGMKQVPKERALRVIDLIARENAGVTARLWREAMAFDSRPRLNDIRCPVLIIAGSQDDAVPLHHAMMLHDGIAGSKLVTIEGADHALIWARPDLLLENVKAFLES